MKLTIWKHARVIGLIGLGIFLSTGADCQANITKRIMMALPCSIQKRVAISMHAFSSLKEEGTEWRLRLLLDDFYDLENEKPLAYYFDEFIQIIEDNPEYFEMLLFTKALKDTTPNKHKVVALILDRLELVKHSKNVSFIKAMLYLPVRKWVRKDTQIPTNKHAKNALAYHAQFNTGR